MVNGASQRGFRSGVLAPSTPLLHSGRIVVRSDRPSSIVAPNRNITKRGPRIIGTDRQAPRIYPRMIRLCSRFDSVLFTPKMSAIPSYGNYSRSLKWKSATSVSSRSAGPGRSSSIAPPKPKCAAPDSSATTRQGIKNTIAPARNVGERARRRPPSVSAVSIGAVVDDPLPHRRAPGAAAAA
jgi:hypothetical protein